MKPKITVTMSGKGWCCSCVGTNVGYGFTPKLAYIDWLSRKTLGH